MQLKDVEIDLQSVSLGINLHPLPHQLSSHISRKNTALPSLSLPWQLGRQLGLFSSTLEKLISHLSSHTTCSSPSVTEWFSAQLAPPCLCLSCTGRWAVHTVFQMQPHEFQTEENHHLSPGAGHTFSNMCKTFLTTDTLLSNVQLICPGSPSGPVPWFFSAKVIPRPSSPRLYRGTRLLYSRYMTWLYLLRLPSDLGRSSLPRSVYC